MKTGRNEPCPCGSGKKFKKCCLLAAEATSSLPLDLEPADLVNARAGAFINGDFAFIYDSYHSDSYFRHQYPDRQAYISHGRQNLGADFVIRECTILKERMVDEEAQVLFYLDTLYQGERSESFELSRFLREKGAWRYHSSQKLTREEFGGSASDIDWSDFDRVKDKVYF